MKKDNFKIIDNNFSDFRKDLEYIYFKYDGKEYKRIFSYSSLCIYDYIFRFKNNKYKINKGKVFSMV